MNTTSGQKDIAEIAITSEANLIKDESHSIGYSMNEIKGVSVEVKKATGNKCNRCWKVLPEVIGKELCLRCNKIINS